MSGSRTGPAPRLAQSFGVGFPAELIPRESDLGEPGGVAGGEQTAAAFQEAPFCGPQHAGREAGTEEKAAEGHALPAGFVDGMAMWALQIGRRVVSGADNP